MEREIMFRGKRIDTGEWITDSETYIRDGDGIWLEDKDKDVVKVYPETVGRHTGLTDRNGVEIYEGDIARIEYIGISGKTHIRDTFTILWNKTEASFCCWDGWNFISLPSSDHTCVIGNIHDNPELT